jgi:hypothetical protein
MTEILTEIIDNIDIKPSYNPKLKGAFKIGRRLLKNLLRQQMTMTSAKLTIKTCFEFDLIPVESILRDDYLKGLYKEKL